jgi:acetyl esterase/lipase
MFSIRDNADNIRISDEIIDNVAVRIYRPINSMRLNAETNKMPAIFYYHGGGFFVGNAGNFSI